MLGMLNFVLRLWRTKLAAATQRARRHNTTLLFKLKYCPHRYIVLGSEAGGDFEDILGRAGGIKHLRRVCMIGGGSGIGNDSDNAAGWIGIDHIEGKVHVFHPKAVVARLIKNKKHAALGRKRCPAGEPLLARGLGGLNLHRNSSVAYLHVRNGLRAW